jgi:hypothetical protein
MNARNPPKWLRFAPQPDGLAHVILGRDRFRSICGLRLARYETHYTEESHYASQPNRCPQCAAILARRAKFPGRTSEEQKAIVDRVKKLLALAERETTNEHEAAQAAARAAELIEKHNLSMGVIDDPDQQKAEKRMGESLGSRAAPHKYILALAVNCQHDVEHYRTTGGDGNKYLVFLGLPANVEAAVLTHAYWCSAADAMYRAARRGIGSDLNAHDYKQGFAANILARVRAARRAAALDPSVAALIHIGSAVARRAMEAERVLFGGGFSYSNQVRDPKAYERGYGDGSRVDLHGARTSRILDEARIE